MKIKPDYFSEVPSVRTRDRRHKFKHIKFQLNKKYTSYWEGDQTLDYAVQNVCGVSAFGNTKNLPVHSPGQPALANHPWAGELEEIS